MPGVLKRASTKVSASLLYNNLSCNGRSVAYVHHSEVILVPDNAVTSGAAVATPVRIVDQDHPQAVIKQARMRADGAPARALRAPQPPQPPHSPVSHPIAAHRRPHAPSTPRDRPTLGGP